VTKSGTQEPAKINNRRRHLFTPPFSSTYYQMHSNSIYAPQSRKQCAALLTQCSRWSGIWNTRKPVTKIARIITPTTPSCQAPKLRKPSKTRSEHQSHGSPLGQQSRFKRDLSHYGFCRRLPAINDRKKKKQADCDFARSEFSGTYVSPVP
jgi:hypothetical protein